MDDIAIKVRSNIEKYISTSKYRGSDNLSVLLDSISFVALVIDLEEEFAIELNDLFLEFPKISIKRVEEIIKNELVK